MGSRGETIIAGGILAVLLAGLLGLNACYAKVMYGEWKCAFIQCRKEVK